MLRSVRVYRLESGWHPSAEELETQLATRRFQPCGSQDTLSRGWATVGNEGRSVLVCGDFIYVKLCIEKRKVPSDVLRRELDVRLAEFEKAKGYRPGRKQKAELAESITMEMLPKAFGQVRGTDVIIDVKSGWMMVGAGSDSAAEDVLEMLRISLTSFPVRRLETERPAMAVMRDWLLAKEASYGFALGDLLQLKGEGSVRYADKELPFEEVHKHIEEGMQPVRLEMSFGEVLSFRMGMDGELAGLKFLEKITEEEAQSVSGDQVEDFKATVVLRAGVLRNVLAAWVEASGGLAPTVQTDSLREAA